MTERLVQVGVFPTQPDAMKALAVLQSQGIAATLEGPVGANWIGAPPVLPCWRLFVAAHLAGSASALLAEVDGVELPGGTPGVDAGPGMPEEGGTEATEDLSKPAARGDESTGDESGPSPDADVVEAWARRTRWLAIVGVLLFWCLIGAIARLVSPPAGLDASPSARRLVFQARLLVYATLALYALVVWLAMRS